LFNCPVIASTQHLYTNVGDVSDVFLNTYKTLLKYQHVFLTGKPSSFVVKKNTILFTQVTTFN